MERLRRERQMKNIKRLIVRLIGRKKKEQKKVFEWWDLI
ncbi:hypothetical protein CHCC20441_3252 [Bacillus licheniformis]|nr:hypothetical protein CHCC5025_4775 [Bacillus licheniformis]TWJ99398.1 hypothetical protein CHCC20493_1938 [Bacillus licheniformis]TWK05679.1 hypothetical protein CHCC20441_3252 [Bacillus licheniformis]TWK06732.1 hypothetical protein CHCC20487_2826 [Bacillus licheniformis]TWK19031.1 hypothetical protein CHCC20440_0967 [Bacillus licheniformis]